jgi:predicted phage terminase large subunit-like protein
LNFTDTVAAVRLITAKWPQARVKLVEDKANGTAVIDSLKKEIGGIIPITPHESKEARAAAVSPFVEAGNVLLPSVEIALFAVEELIEETTVFPNGAHDDQVDALSQALGRFYLRPGQGQMFISFYKDQTARDKERVVVPEELRGLPTLGERTDVSVCECRPGKRRFFEGRCTVCQGVKAA